MTRQEMTILSVCLTVGAVVSFSLTGDAALGTAAGAAVGLGLGRALAHRHHFR